MKNLFYILALLCGFCLVIVIAAYMLADSSKEVTPLQLAIRSGQFNYFVYFGIPSIGLFLFSFIGDRYQKLEDKKVVEKSKDILDKF